MRRSALSILAATVAVSVTPAAQAVAAPNNNNSQKLREAVSVAGIREHQQALQEIADANDGNRLAGSSGHEASAEYVAAKARAAGYDVTFQEFDYQFDGDLSTPVLTKISPAPPKDYVNGLDFISGGSNTDVGSANGDVTAPLSAVDLQIPPLGTSTSGCTAADFAGFVVGDIALVQRGLCGFVDKVANATAAGASAVIIMNEGNTPARSGLINPDVTGSTIPVLATDFETGRELANGVTSGRTGTTLRVKVNRFLGALTTRNVIADSRGGDTDNTIVVGAHLDSVESGPGINDNGSGSGVILEIAEQMAKVKSRNHVRYIWFSAEESGLLGAEYYVQQLSEANRDRIAAMLDFDMLGSPNFVRFVYDGDGNAEPGNPVGPEGSGAIEEILKGYFTAKGLQTEPTDFDGRSDYDPFIDVGIPAGGVFAGAEGIKTPEEAAIYGGAAGEQYDPCYHAFCDTFATQLGVPPAIALFDPDNAELLRNNGAVGLDQMSDAAAHATIVLAQSTQVVNGKRGKGNFNGEPKVERAAQR